MSKKYFIIALLFILALSCTSTAITVISSWQGTFSYSSGNGTVVYWDLYNDNSMAGEWQVSNVVLGTSSGSYSIFSNAISFSLNGTATYSGFSSNYALIGNGTMSDTTADGTFSINYTDPDWTDLSGDWTVTKK